MSGLRNCALAQGDDLYGMLGCSRSAYQADIRKGFRLWGIRAHPGKSGDAEVFAKTCNAWEVLGNEDFKDRYDRYGLAALGWDGGVSFSSPEAAFASFFRRHGGWEIVSGFVRVPNGSGWEGYASVFAALQKAMPALATGMSCLGDFEPAGRVVPSAGVTRETSFDGVEECADAIFGFTPPPSQGSRYHSVSGAASLVRTDSMKARFLEQFRKKSGATPEPAAAPANAAGCFGAAMDSSAAPYQYQYGMPAKDAAMLAYRERVGSNPPSRSSSLYQMHSDQNAEQGLKGKWLSDFRTRSTRRSA